MHLRSEQTLKLENRTECKTCQASSCEWVKTLTPQTCTHTLIFLTLTIPTNPPTLTQTLSLPSKCPMEVWGPGCSYSIGRKCDTNTHTHTLKARAVTFLLLEHTNELSFREANPQPACCNRIVPIVRSVSVSALLAQHHSSPTFLCLWFTRYKQTRKQSRERACVR